MLAVVAAKEAGIAKSAHSVSWLTKKYRQSNGYWTIQTRNNKRDGIARKINMLCNFIVDFQVLTCISKYVTFIIS